MCEHDHHPTAEALVGAAIDLAERFAGGATMWCVAPKWPWHARHLAVEFVHPVIVGTQALPAIAVDDVDPVAAVRNASQPGDILVVIGDPDTAHVGRLLRRAEPWGLLAVSIAIGEASTGFSGRRVWIAGGSDDSSANGDVTAVYHVLWELTQIALEHRGVHRDRRRDGRGAHRQQVCATCADDARVGEVTLRHAAPAGRTPVRLDGDLAFLDCRLAEPVQDGDLVLVHGGIAVAMVEDSR